MRPDQISRLRELSESLADRFILEADPSEWPGGHKSPADMTKQERGDQHWCKKLAIGTASVLRYTLELQEPRSDFRPQDEIDDSLDRKIKEAEQRAANAVKRALDKAAKRTFDQRVHGAP